MSWSTSDTSNAELGRALIDQCMELWVGPEIEKRWAEGTLPHDFVLRSAQILMDVGQMGPKVRLNDEVRAVAQITTTRSITEGEVVRTSDLNELLSVELTEQDPNSAHITMLAIGDDWNVAFDFRYNSTRAAAHLALAEDFLATAGAALQAERLAVFAENLFAACELAAKTMLLAIPIEKYLTSKRHTSVSSDFNRFAKDGMWDQSFAAALNRLAALREKARYASGRLDLGLHEAGTLLTTVRLMIETGAGSIAPRATVPANIRHVTPAACIT